MPFLWKQKYFNLNFIKKPSPKHKNRFVHSDVFIERASLFISFLTKLSVKRKFFAGMTVEAALVLPLFLFFFVNLGSAIEMIRLHGNLELALWNAGNQMCLYGYVTNGGQRAGQALEKNENGTLWDGMAGIALSYTYIKSEVASYAGEGYLAESPLAKGISGLQFWESDLPKKDDTVDILMTYQVSAPFSVPAVRPFRMQNRYYGHLWTGYDLSNASRLPGGGEDEDIVYITDTGYAYHESRECTHLKLSIKEVTLQEALNSRNEYGGKYSECQKCRGAPHTGAVFIGKDGDCYHYARDCSGLKRTIYTITRKQAKEKGYKACSRCGGG